jgi:DNA-binding ferritin-like protein
MKNDFILSLENKLHGYHTRLKELHFSASSMSEHKLIDDFDEELLEFDDNIMEDAQAIFGRIRVGMIQPVLPKSTTFGDLLNEIRADLVKTKDTLTEKMYTGIINVVDDFFHTVNKNIYLNNIINKIRD